MIKSERATVTVLALAPMGLKPCLHWRGKHGVTSNVARNVTPYLLTLANRNYPICVAPLKVAKASRVK